MFKSLTEKSLQFLGIEKEFDFEKEDDGEKENKIEEENSDDSNIFKIPKYLERAIFIGSLLMINAIIYNLIILPLKFIIIVIKAILQQKIDQKIFTILSLKVFLIIIGIIVRTFLEYRFPSFQMYHNLRFLSGMKIFTFIKILEFMNILLNKFNRDYDVQIVRLLKESKIKKKIISIIIMIISLSLNIITFWCYMITISITLNDANNFIYPLFLKLNIIEIKKSGKFVKQKKISQTIINDIYDRFNILSCLFLVVIQNYFDNKLNSHNFIDYGFRVFFLILSEMIFDWLKDIIIFKLSIIKAKYLKSFTLELAVFHDKMKYNCFNPNGGKSIEPNKNFNEAEKYLPDYINIIENFKLKYINKEKLEKYLGFIDFENLLSIELQHNVLVICIIVICHLKSRLDFYSLKIPLYILILLIFRKFSQINLTLFISNQFVKLKQKDENFFNTISRGDYYTSDDYSEISEQLVFT